jgi:transcriptional regulator GlxA family with amidase domain
MQLIGLFLPENFEVCSFTPFAVFEAANAVLDQPAYRLRVLSEYGGSLTGAFGVEVITCPFRAEDYDTLVVAGAPSVTSTSAHFRAVLQSVAQTAGRVASIRLGTFALAEAGLLKGRRATTHWAHADELQSRFPETQVDADCIFTEDGPFWTAAGMNAGVDLALRLIERDFGGACVQLVAARLMVQNLRAGGQSQHSASLGLRVKSDRIEMALEYARRNLRMKLTVEDLADAARLSPRQFSRLFNAQTGCSPARAVERLRLEAAAILIRQGRLPFETIAGETGFGDGERMRRAFTRGMGQPPRAVRRTAQEARIGGHSLASLSSERVGSGV